MQPVKGSLSSVIGVGVAQRRKRVGECKLAVSWLQSRSSTRLIGAGFVRSRSVLLRPWTKGPS